MLIGQAAYHAAVGTWQGQSSQIARESNSSGLAHGGEHDDQVDALVNLILGLVVERIAPQEVHYL